MRDHTQLRAFELADELAILIYRLTREFPGEELYGLTSQMRRAAISVPSNIVEGCARESQTEYFRFLEIAFGSLRELHYQFSTLSLRNADKKRVVFLPLPLGEGRGEGGGAYWVAGEAPPWDIAMRMTFLAATRKSWKPRRFWARLFVQCARTNGLQPTA